ncbi:hypothetical protein K435DRAFT_854208 [Dendrothele bispora CBS 962.96]|uniref:Uncharacterized protein n=1 Tax=Dendrothele bispora (strain CBS 962.96) TaxID=1314807 RepID=A0A4S8MEY4_DENBC|nr:hypothetical protein K435DRAFT_854208 [Dendrothele bispora CBS 962.96]
MPRSQSRFEEHKLDNEDDGMIDSAHRKGSRRRCSSNSLTLSFLLLLSPPPSTLTAGVGPGGVLVSSQDNDIKIPPAPLSFVVVIVVVDIIAPVNVDIGVHSNSIFNKDLVYIPTPYSTKTFLQQVNQVYTDSTREVRSNMMFMRA